jgi:xanthine dehydrogenase molybdenum-binding subunit
VTAIEVEYEKLPSLTTPDQVLQNNEVKIHEDGNLLHEYDVKRGEKEPSAPDDVIVETTTRTQKAHHAAIEPHVCLANFDRSSKLTVWSPCQGAYGVRTISKDDS